MTPLQEAMDWAEGLQGWYDILSQSAEKVFRNIKILLCAAEFRAGYEVARMEADDILVALEAQEESRSLAAPERVCVWTWVLSGGAKLYRGSCGWEHWASTNQNRFCPGCGKRIAVGSE